MLKFGARRGEVISPTSSPNSEGVEATWHSVRLMPLQHYLTTTLEAFEAERLEGPATTDEGDEGPGWCFLA